MVITIILAIDPALTISGYSLFKITNKDYYQLRKGQITLDSNLNYFERILTFHNQLDNLSSEHNLNCVVIEDIHYQKQTGIAVYKKLAHLQFYLLYYFHLKQIRTELVQVNTWRNVVCNTFALENAKKNTWQQFMREYLNDSIDDNQADAIGIGFWKFINSINNNSASINKHIHLQ